MSQIMKSFMGVFFILFMGMVAVGVLGMYATVLSAQDTHAMIIDDLEDSNFYPEVIRSCFQSASAKGYRLSITLYEATGEAKQALSAAEIENDTSQVIKAYVRLEFSTNVPFLGAMWKQQIAGYAR